jgi:hypothetical protein
MAQRDTYQDVAGSVPFDNASNGFVADEVQGAIEELQYSGGVSASPGFTWGRSGNISGPNAWLQNDGVPSNLTGRNFPLYNGKLSEVSVSNESVNTFNIQIYEHDGSTYTLLATVSLSSLRNKIQSFTNVVITRGKELAVQVSSGSCKNIVVQLICKGTTIP